MSEIPAEHFRQHAHQHRDDPPGDAPLGWAQQRYARQVRFAPLGATGQRHLAASTALVCGCGALGSVAAELLVRAGVGRVRIVDRDFVELGNLHRQTLFDEQDVREQLPKAIAAARHLERINTAVVVEPAVADVTASNLDGLAAGVDVIVDGLDNFDTRYLLNDYSHAHQVPWVFGGCVGAEGQAMAILPGETACLSCLLPTPPPPELQPTCETAGVVGPIVNVIAAWESMEALKILSGNRACVNRQLCVFDLWTNHIRALDVPRSTDPAACPTCGLQQYPWLDGRRGAAPLVLCGRNAVQIASTSPHPLDLSSLGRKLREVGQVLQNDYLVRLKVDEYQLTVFADGRTIVTGTDDPSQARAIAARYLGG
jgi:adenylyltransferase/sulfurtransferase